MYNVYMDYKNKYIKYKSKYINLSGGAKPVVKEIYFIRHGQTEWNQLKKSQGQEADIELNDNGRQEASKTGIYLRDFRQLNKHFDCIISSPMMRAKETAIIIAKELNFDRNIIENDDIKEVKKGNMSGLTNKDDLIVQFDKSIKDKMDTIKDPIIKYDIDNVYKQDIFFNDIIKENQIGIHGIETAQKLVGRAKKFIKYLTKIKHDKIIVVSHSGFLEVLLKLIFNLNILPMGNMPKSKNCTICYCTYKNKTFHMVSPQNTEHLI